MCIIPEGGEHILVITHLRIKRGEENLPTSLISLYNDALTASIGVRLVSGENTDIIT